MHAFVLSCQSGRHILTVTITHYLDTKTWYAIAIESPGDGMDEVLDNHRHDMLGGYTSKMAAKQAARAYAKAWKPTRANCKCKPIKKSR